jgi:hypothetical protein
MMPTLRVTPVFRIVVLSAVVAFLVSVTQLAGKQPARGRLLNPPENGSHAKPGETKTEPASIEAHFCDGSNMKVIVREERLELVTAYGNLSIPMADICRIDFGFRIDAKTAKRVNDAIATLGSGDNKAREAAAAELLGLGEHAFPALVKAASGTDPEVVQRAEAIISQIRERVQPERLDRPANDVVLTAECKFTGRINAEGFKVTTVPFGDQQVKLGDLATLGLKAYLDPEPNGADQFLQNGPMWIQGQGLVPGGGFPGGGFPGGGPGMQRGVGQRRPQQQGGGPRGAGGPGGGGPGGGRPPQDR